MEPFSEEAPDVKSELDLVKCEVNIDDYFALTRIVITGLAVQETFCVIVYGGVVSVGIGTTISLVAMAITEIVPWWLPIMHALIIFGLFRFFKKSVVNNPRGRDAMMRKLRLQAEAINTIDSTTLLQWLRGESPVQSQRPQSGEHRA